MRVINKCRFEIALKTGGDLNDYREEVESLFEDSTNLQQLEKDHDKLQAKYDDLKEEQDSGEEELEEVRGELKDAEARVGILEDAVFKVDNLIMDCDDDANADTLRKLLKEIRETLDV